jgi:cell division control protein 7
VVIIESLFSVRSGTFSAVYKAIDLEYGQYDNSLWDRPDVGDMDNAVLESTAKPKRSTSSTAVGSSRRDDRKLVAIKRLYPTSSPRRILNEIMILEAVRYKETPIP